jgi:hypothetical protein
MSYRVIIVPPGTTLAENTVRLLREFVRAGGPVLAMEPVPTLIDGRPTRGPALPEGARRVTLGRLPGLLDELLPFDVRVPGRPEIWVHHRCIDGADCYFLANIDRDRGGVATVQLRGTGHLEAWDAATGEVHPLPCRQGDGITEVVLNFPPVGSHLLVMRRDQPLVSIEPVREQVVAVIRLNDTWDLSLHGPNALTLDTARVRLGNEGEWGDWSKAMHILDAHAVVAQAGSGTDFELRFTFDAAVCPSEPVYLIVESPERFAIAVNGQAIVDKDLGWWTDISFRKADVSDAVRAGQNKVVLGGSFARDTELESVYLVGDFGVQGQRLRRENQLNGQIFDRYGPDFSVTGPPDRVGPGHNPDGPIIDLTPQGLAFFAGRVTLRQSITLPPVNGRAVLDIHNLRAAVAHVRVNGEHQGSVAWAPHRVDVTPGLRPGENEIEIELVGTLRNLLGPHHLNGGDLLWTGPGEFRDKSRWTDDYTLVPFGLDGAGITILRS